MQYFMESLILELGNGLAQKAAQARAIIKQERTPPPSQINSIFSFVVFFQKADSVQSINGESKYSGGCFSLQIFPFILFLDSQFYVSYPIFLQILEKQVLTVAKAVEDKIDDEIAALDRLDLDDIEALRERRLQQMKKMAEKRSRWISLGHGEYSEIPSEKDFFTVVKASERVVCHFYRPNWPCKVLISECTISSFVWMNASFFPILRSALCVLDNCFCW